MLKFLIFDLMGYMGFGLNKWVYKQRPRKFFSKERKPIADTLPKHETRSVYDSDTPQLTGRLNEHKSSDELKEERYTRLSNKIYRIIIYSAVIISLIYTAVNYYNKRETREAAAKARYDKLKTMQKKEMAKGKQMLYEYGNYYLEIGDYKRAVNEFRSLVNIAPDDKKALEAYANSLYLYCINDSMECNNAIKQYRRLIKRDHGSDYQKRLAAIYIHIGQFEKADSLLNNNW